MGTWDNIRTWDLVLPPSRPSFRQLARIRERLRPMDHHLPIAVLGSTPEFRDLIAECGFSRIYIFEKNPASFATMSSLRIHDNPEEVVAGDWLDTLPQFRDIFCAVLSDLTSGNIPYDFRHDFYTAIAGALRAGGLFFDKVLTHPGAHIPLAALLERYESEPLNLLTANRFSCEALFCSTLLDINETVDSSLFYSILAKQTSHKRLQAILKLAKRITPEGCHWWYGRRWSKLAPHYCTSLSLREDEEDEAWSPYFGRLRFFVHEKADCLS
jgi:hypothetical protein